MASHFLLLVVFTVGVSAVFATLLRDEPVAQVRLALMMIAGFLGSTFLIGWLMYPLPL